MWRCRLATEPTDAELIAIQAGLYQFGELLEQSADFADSKSKEDRTHPGKALYWMGYVAAMRDAAQLARETRPLRGVK